MHVILCIAVLHPFMGCRVIGQREGVFRFSDGIHILTGMRPCDPRQQVIRLLRNRLDAVVVCGAGIRGGKRDTLVGNDRHVGGRCGTAVYGLGRDRERGTAGRRLYACGHDDILIELGFCRTAFRS